MYCSLSGPHSLQLEKSFHGNKDPAQPKDDSLDILLNRCVFIIIKKHQTKLRVIIS